MKRLQELCWNFGMSIILPRLCLVGMLPALVLLGPGNIAWIALWPPWFDKLVLFGSALLFTLSIVSNLAISRYLRLAETEGSPYQYAATSLSTKITDYYRIQVTDRDAFCALLKSLRSENPRTPIALWLRIDSLWLYAAVPLLAVALALWGFCWLLSRIRIRPRPVR